MQRLSRRDLQALTERIRSGKWNFKQIHRGAASFDAAIAIRSESEGAAVAAVVLAELCCRDECRTDELLQLLSQLAVVLYQRYITTETGGKLEPLDFIGASNGRNVAV